MSTAESRSDNRTAFPVAPQIQSAAQSSTQSQQSLIWRLIELERGFFRQILAFSAFLLSFRFIFSWSWSMAFAMVLSMFLHECGHALVFRLAKIRFTILFLFPLGAVAAPINKQEDARSDQLHWNTISWLLQAGPAVNVGLMMFFALIRALGTGTLENVQYGDTILRFAQDMVYVNGLLASMNLVPIWTLDAGQLFKVIYNSLEEKEDNWLTGLLLSGTGLLLLRIIGIPGLVSWTIIVVNTLTRFGWVVFLLIFAVGILNKQGRDEAINAYSKQAMSNRQIAIHLGIYFVLVGLTLWIFAGSII
jgi:Zn-dependent protease